MLKSVDKNSPCWNLLTRTVHAEIWEQRESTLKSVDKNSPCWNLRATKVHAEICWKPCWSLLKWRLENELYWKKLILWQKNQNTSYHMLVNWLLLRSTKSSPAMLWVQINFILLITRISSFLHNNVCITDVLPPIFQAWCDMAMGQDCRSEIDCAIVGWK